MVHYFAEKHLIKETKENIFAKVCFFQHHPKINKGLLDAAISKTILSRSDFTDDILSPIVEGEYYYTTASLNVALRNQNVSQLLQKSVTCPCAESHSPQAPDKFNPKVNLQTCGIIQMLYET